MSRPSSVNNPYHPFLVEKGGREYTRGSKGELYPLNLKPMEWSLAALSMGALYLLYRAMPKRP